MNRSGDVSITQLNPLTKIRTHSPKLRGSSLIMYASTAVTSAVVYIMATAIEIGMNETDRNVQTVAKKP